VLNWKQIKLKIYEKEFTMLKEATPELLKVIKDTPRTEKPNEYITVGEITYIILCGKTGEPICSTIIDTKNFHKVSPYRWHLSNGYATTNILGGSGSLKLHRLILGPDKSRGEPLVNDHKNRNPLDNREENLRYITHQENILNSDRCDQTALNKILRQVDIQEITKDFSPEMRDLLLWSQTENYKRFIDFLITLYPEDEQLPTPLQRLKILQDWPDLLVAWRLKERSL